MSTARDILQTVTEQKEALVSDLRQLVSIESPSTDPHLTGLAFDFIEASFKEMGYYCFRMTGDAFGGYLYARPQNKPKNVRIQLLIGHIDTVWPAGTLEKMPILEKQNKLSGPGVYDMKSGLIQILYALKAIDKSGMQPSVLPVILINADEEVGSKESTPTIKRLAKIAARAYILEPSLGKEGKLKTRRSGVGRYELKLTGHAAHAGLDPGKGASAIVELSHVIQKLFALNDPSKSISVNVGMIDGGVRPNVIAPESTAVVDVRVPTVKDAERIDQEIKSLYTENADIDLTITGNIGRPPMEGTPENRALWELAKITGESLSFDLQEATAGGGSDGNTTSQYTGTLDGLGAIGDGAHALHEFAYVDKLIERTALLALLILAKPLNPNPQNHE